MGVPAPEDLHRIFASLFNAGDLDGLVQLYEPEARLVPQPGVTIKGHEAVRQSLQQFLSLKGQITMTTDFVIRGEGLALLRGKWRLTGTGPDGKSLRMSGRNVEVARQQADGSWLFTIDHAFGADCAAKPTISKPSCSLTVFRRAAQTARSPAHSSTASVRSHRSFRENLYLSQASETRQA